MRPLGCWIAICLGRYGNLHRWLFSPCWQLGSKHELVLSSPTPNRHRIDHSFSIRHAHGLNCRIATYSGPWRHNYDYNDFPIFTDCESIGVFRTLRSWFRYRQRISVPSSSEGWLVAFRAAIRSRLWHNCLRSWHWLIFIRPNRQCSCQSVK